MAAKEQVSFDLECIDLPDARLPEYDSLRIGIQEKREVKQDVACSVRQARFMFTLEVSLDSDAAPRFFGPYVQGKPGDQFVYLVWGERDGEAWVTNRRIKVPLTDLPLERITAAVESHQPIALRITMTNNKGEPIAATLKQDHFEWL